MVHIADTEYSSQEGIREILDKMSQSEIFRQNRTLFEKQLVEKKCVSSKIPTAVYGFDDYLNCLIIQRKLYPPAF